ncbi:MAG: acyltransferase [bacterium]
MSSSYLSEAELKSLGLDDYGDNVRISDAARIHNPETLSLGSNVRIDDFTVLTGDITIGSNVHIAPFTSISGGEGIILEDFASVSSHVAIFTVTANYTGGSMANPTIPDEYKPDRDKGPVKLEKHALIGSRSVVLPGITIHEGGSVGAMSLVNEDVDEWTFYLGYPAQKIKNRDEETIKELEDDFLSNP